jgi:hypothetical protein
MTPEAAFTTLKPFIAKHGTPLQREAFAAFAMVLRERTLKIKALRIERDEASAARSEAVEALRSHEAELALLKDRIEQMEADYQLFQTVAPPNIPRAEFVAQCFAAWQREAVHSQGPPAPPVARQRANAKPLADGSR